MDASSLSLRLAVQPPVDVFDAELRRAREENKRLNDMLRTMSLCCRTLESRLDDLMSSSSSPAKKRKSESLDDGVASKVTEDSTRRPIVKHEANIYKTYTRSDPSDTTSVVKDGYQWRKYGQKVTKDNASPRVYFKCSFAPSCPVKKKVQRSAEDKSILVATYEGEHTHAKASANSSVCSVSPMISFSNTNPEFESPELQRIVVEHMASSLSKDPSFISELAATISGRILQLSISHK